MSDKVHIKKKRFVNSHIDEMLVRELAGFFSSWSELILGKPPPKEQLL